MKRCVDTYALKGKEFLGAMQILFSDISLNRTPLYRSGCDGLQDGLRFTA